MGADRVDRYTQGFRGRFVGVSVRDQIRHPALGLGERPFLELGVIADPLRAPGARFPHESLHPCSWRQCAHAVVHVPCSVEVVERGLAFAGRQQQPAIAFRSGGPQDRSGAVLQDLHRLSHHAEVAAE